MDAMLGMHLCTFTSDDTWSGYYKDVLDEAAHGICDGLPGHVHLGCNLASVGVCVAQDAAISSSW
jgi:hypothetical protein